MDYRTTTQCILTALQKVSRCNSWKHAVDLTSKSLLLHKQPAPVTKPLPAFQNSFTALKTLKHFLRQRSTEVHSLPQTKKCTVRTGDKIEIHHTFRSSSQDGGRDAQDSRGNEPRVFLIPALLRCQLVSPRSQHREQSEQWWAVQCWEGGRGPGRWGVERGGLYLKAKTITGRELHTRACTHSK